MLVSDSGKDRVVLLNEAGDFLGSFGTYREIELGAIGQRVLQVPRGFYGYLLSLSSSLSVFIELGDICRSEPCVHQSRCVFMTTQS